MPSQRLKPYCILRPDCRSAPSSHRRHKPSHQPRSRHQLLSMEPPLASTRYRLPLQLPFPHRSMDQLELPLRDQRQGRDNPPTSPVKLPFQLHHRSEFKPPQCRCSSSMLNRTTAIREQFRNLSNHFRRRSQFQVIQQSMEQLVPAPESHRLIPWVIRRFLVTARRQQSEPAWLLQCPTQFRMSLRSAGTRTHRLQARSAKLINVSRA